MTAPLVALRSSIPVLLAVATLVCAERATAQPSGAANEALGYRAGSELANRHLAVGDTASALATWRETLAAAPGPGPGRDQLVGRYLKALVQAGWTSPTEPTAAFSALLDATTGDAPDSEPYWAFLGQLADVIPDSIRAVAFPDGDWRRGVAPSAKQALLEWWVGQDPFPATDANERVEEHLLRVRAAWREFPDPSRPQGYDDRGRLFVRFGAPTTRRTLTYDDPRLVFGMSRANVGVSRSSFPRNEVWSYSALDASMVYLMVERGEVYREAQAVDLLPSSLRSVSGRGARRQSLARVSLLAMEAIFTQLATTSVEYGDALGTVQAALAQSGSPFANPGDVITTVQRRLSVRETERERIQRQREPPSYSRLATDLAAAPYLAQATRYLNDEGDTSLLLTWTLAGADAMRDAGDVVLGGTVVRSPRTLDRQVVTSRLQVASADQRSGLDAFDPVQVVVPCSGDCRYAVQMSLYSVDGAGSPSVQVGSSLWDVKPMPHLRAGGLEMSDLRTVDPLRNAPLLVPKVRPGTPVSLYFEAYGFQGGATRSRIHIEYDIVRRRRGTFLRRTRETPTSSELRLQPRGATTEQYLILRTSDWSDADEVEIQVRVRDERTGEVVERSTRFEVAPDA